MLGNVFDIRSEKHRVLLKYSTSSDRPQLVGSSIENENEHDAMVAVEGTTDEDDKYFTEEEEILWPANLYPGTLYMGFHRKGLHHRVPVIRYK